MLSAAFSRNARLTGIRMLRLLVLALTSAWLFPSCSASAQSFPRPLAAWDQVQQLPASSHLKVAADQHGGDCVLQSVSVEGIVCLHGSATRALPRGQIRSIKLARRGRSAGLGLGIGAGIGVGIGVAVGSAINDSDKGNLLHVSGGKAAAVGAGIGGILGAATGVLVGYTSDLFASPVIYKR